jgi:hypothetical protein
LRSSLKPSVRSNADAELEKEDEEEEEEEEEKEKWYVCVSAVAVAVAVTVSASLTLGISRHRNNSIKLGTLRFVRFIKAIISTEVSLSSPNHTRRHSNDFCSSSQALSAAMCSCVRGSTEFSLITACTASLLL